MKDMHCDITFLNATHGPLYFLIEDVGEVGESSDEITNGVIITEFSTLVVLFHIELG